MFQVATGNVGTEMIKRIQHHPDLELIGLHCYSPEKIGKDAGEIVGLDPVGVKATGPDGKDFNLFFDKESGLPVKLVAKVVGFMGDEFTQETMFSDYQEMGGIKKATKIQTKRNGEKFQEQQVTEFKLLDQVDPKTFAEPQ